MKNIYFIILITLLDYKVNAQTPINITFDNFLLKGNDTMPKVSNPNDLLDLLFPKTNAQWDLSKVTYNNQYNVRHREVVDNDDNPFSDSDFYDTGSYNISGNLKYEVIFYFKGTDEKFSILGEKIPVSQAISIGSVTFNGSRKFSGD